LGRVLVVSDVREQLLSSLLYEALKDLRRGYVAACFGKMDDKLVERRLAKTDAALRQAEASVAEITR
jgi:hypothetical protein